MIDNLVSAEAKAEVYAQERSGCHSSRHWFKVAQIGVALAIAEKADPEVALLFGFYHDCRRENDGYDPEHGLRAARLALTHWQNGWLNISKYQLEDLMFACEHHNGGTTHAEAVIGVCWDADRLDLPRVGTQTSPEFLSTKTAKEMAKYQRNFYHGVCDCG